MSEQIQARMSQVVQDYLDGKYDGDSWKYEEKNGIIFSGGIAGLDGKISSVRFCIFVKEQTVSCYHIAPIQAPDDRKAMVAEYLTRANYGMNLGNFEMDWSDGEIRFKVSFLHHDLLLDDREKVCENMTLMMHMGTQIWERYGDNLAAIIFGFADDKSVEELVAEVEEAF